MGGRPRASCLGAELGAPTAEQGKEAAVCDPTRHRSNARERQGVAWGFKILGIFRLPQLPVSDIACFPTEAECELEQVKSDYEMAVGSTS
jgi:hypothetical protein